MMLTMNKSGNAYISLLVCMALFSGCAGPADTERTAEQADSILATIPADSTIEVDTIISADSAICIYSWDDQTGGQMIHFSAVYQVRDDEGRGYTYAGLPDWEEQDIEQVTGIYVLPHPERHLYLVTSYFREWAAVDFITFTTYERIGHSLRQVPLFRDEQGKLVSQYSFEYDAQAVWREIICYWDTATTSILTDGYGSYQWSGEVMEPLKVNIPTGSMWTNGCVYYEAVLDGDSVRLTGCTLHEGGFDAVLPINHTGYQWLVNDSDQTISEWIMVEGMECERFDGDELRYELHAIHTALTGVYRAEKGEYFAFYADGTVSLSPDQAPQPYTVELAYDAPTNVILLPDGRRYGFRVTDDFLFLHEADWIDDIWQLSDRMVLLLERINPKSSI